MTKITHYGLWLDFSSMSKEDRRTCIISSIFAFIAGLNYISIYTEYQPQFMDYFGCSILGMVIGQMYFYKKFYE